MHLTPKYLCVSAAKVTPKSHVTNVWVRPGEPALHEDKTEQGSGMHSPDDLVPNAKRRGP